MWSRGGDMPDQLNIRTQPPENILEDVELFIEGKATFHELPPKQGRRKRVIRTLVDAGGDNNDVSGRAVNAGQSVQRERGAGGTGLSSVPSSPVQSGTKRKTARRRHPSTDLPKSSGSTASLVKKVAVPKAITMEPSKGTEVVKRKRGRPRKVR